MECLRGTAFQPVIWGSYSCRVVTAFNGTVLFLPFGAEPAPGSATQQSARGNWPETGANRIAATGKSPPEDCRHAPSHHLAKLYLLSGFSAEQASQPVVHRLANLCIKPVELVQHNSGLKAPYFRTLQTSALLRRTLLLQFQGALNRFVSKRILARI